MITKKISWFMLAAIAIAFASCGGGKNKTEETASKTRVRVDEVRLVPVEQLQTFTATVEADAVNNIASGAPARIRRILVDVGASVRRGQALVQLDGANLSQQQTQLETLRRDYQRYSELHKVGGMSQQQLDQMKAQLDVAETAYLNLAENTTLTSPISGVVTARNYDPGDMPAGQPILTVQSINPVKVVINVSESFYSQVSVGMPLEVQMDVFGDEVFAGKVSLIHPTIDPVSHTFGVEVQIANNDLRIRPGMFSRVTMNFGTHDRPLIPDVAVLKQAGSNDRYVFVENGGVARYTNVELGQRIGDKIEIISGLQVGDRVIIHGNSNLIDQSEVEVVE